MRQYLLRYFLVAVAAVVLVAGTTRVFALVGGTAVLANIFQASSDDPSAQTPDDEDEAEFSGTVESIAADAWVVSGITVVVTPETEIDAGIGVGDVVKVEGSLNLDGSVTAREIKVPDDQDDDQDEDEAEFIGTVESISADVWMVSGITVLVTPDTEIEGEFGVGDVVKVEGTLNPDGSVTAREIEADDDAADDDENDDVDDDDGEDDDNSGHGDDGDEDDNSGPGDGDDDDDDDDDEDEEDEDDDSGPGGGDDD